MIIDNEMTKKFQPDLKANLRILSNYVSVKNGNTILKCKNHVNFLIEFFKRKDIDPNILPTIKFNWSVKVIKGIQLSVKWKFKFISWIKKRK